MEITNIDLIESFAQGEVNLPLTNGSVGNCASIGLIKASIEVFGLNNVFTLEKNDNNFQVTFKNNISVTFTEMELERSNEVADFKLNETNPEKLILYKSIRDYAQIALCAMVKRVMEIGEAGDGIGDFENALIALNDGANSPSLPEKLGLEDYNLQKGVFSGAKEKGMFGWFKGHTVYISQGVRDNYGKVSTDTWRYPKKIKIVDYKVF